AYRPRPAPANVPSAATPRPAWPPRARSRGRRLAGRGAAVAPPDGSPAEQPTREPGTQAVPPVHLRAEGPRRNDRQLELEAAARDAPPCAIRTHLQHEHPRSA